MKKVFVAAAIVLGTISFSACDTKPADATDAATETVDSVAGAATETIDSVQEAATDAIDSTHQAADSASH